MNGLYIKEESNQVFILQKIQEEIMFAKDKNKEGCGLYCSCGCNKGVVFKADTDDSGCTLALVSDIFHMHTDTGLTRFKKKCKRIWNIIRNKEYIYFDICIAPDDLEEFKKFVAEW